MGVRSLNRKGLTNLWEQIAESERCDQKIISNWQNEYPPAC